MATPQNATATPTLNRAEKTRAEAHKLVDLLLSLGKGRLVKRLIEQLDDATAIVHATRKPATVALHLKLKPDSEDAIDLSARVVSKLPEDVERAIMFVDDNNQLTREAPRKDA